ncbi:hypothetical protein RFI_11515 [Reticulomyxa filosa]|uniref:Glycosyl hydrolase family 31 C-terminal domain-containing protein n=1 Tax=Reticulomyxa filosa TaxID=46433 RepID=X6NHY4_RETFI|nr:hypothetical protein RFI_11515 [Reticulomyxa filosa]|eukprot:ETO25621.1 hypothetical protein RFI_11515 [Reticulomyxa filosa]
MRSIKLKKKKKGPIHGKISILKDRHYNNEQSYCHIDDAYINGQEYYIGHNILVSPITNTSGGSFNLTQWTLWLPPGEWYEEHSGIYYSGDQYLTRWFDLSEIPIYVRSGAILVKQPFEASLTLGRAGLAYYSHLRFEIYPTQASVQSGSTQVYEDDGFTNDYLDTTDTNSHAFTYFDYTFNSSHFRAQIETIGDYPYLPSQRQYSVLIRNVFPPTAVRCGNQQMSYIYNWFDGGDSFDGWYFDGIKMAVVVNCPDVTTNKDKRNERQNISQLFVEKHFRRTKYPIWLCSSNLTDCAEMGFHLGNVATDLTTFGNLVSNFNTLFTAAVSQVENLQGVDYNRDRYAINLLQTV